MQPRQIVLTLALEPQCLERELQSVVVVVVVIVPQIVGIVPNVSDDEFAIQTDLQQPQPPHLQPRSGLLLGHLALSEH